jgi:DNA polymerase-4
MARTVVLRLRFTDFSRATRSHTLSEATHETQVILEAARVLLATATPMIEERGITLVGVALTNLEDAGAAQLTLPFGHGREQALDTTLDDIRERYGSDAITRAALIGRERAPAVPLLPD